MKSSIGLLTLSFFLSLLLPAVDNRDVGQSSSMLRAIDTATGSKLADMTIEGDALQAMTLVSEEDAAQKAAAIREESGKKIPSLEALFVTTAGD